MLFKEQLDQMQCAEPGCTHENHDKLYLHGQCHPDSGAFVCYKLNEGLIEMICAKCKTHICEIVVGSNFFRSN